MAEYIDRTALGIGYADPKEFINPAHAEGWNTAIQIINEASAADVAPVVCGGWIPLFESDISGWNPDFAGNDPIGGYMCSVCKEEAIYDCNDEFVLSKFCPNCGAKMDEEV